MVQVIHQHSNFSSKILYFFLNPNKKKKTHFLPTFLSLTYFFPSTFLPTKFSKDQKETGLRLNLENFDAKKKIEKLTFFSCVWFIENHKEKKMEKNYVEKLSEISDKIFHINFVESLIKVSKRISDFSQKNFRPHPTSH